MLLLFVAYGLSWGIGRAVTLIAGIDDAILSFVIGAAVVLFTVLCAVFLWTRTRHRLTRAIELADVDYMDGLDFERYVCKLLERQGYRNVSNIRGSGDFGVDVVAEMNGTRYAIQVKRYRGKVSRRAVADAVAGKYQFDCDAAMVVTNSYYTDSARVLAESADCVLIDRDTLADWVLDFQRG
ncbi:MAG: restriction endonuclease [Caldilineaceae bacterium]|nr:restriction endonuclease [Caldilineaceae bacterium]